MNKKHIGSNVMDTIKEWEKSPAFKKTVNEHIEKAKLAKMLKEIREKEHLSQLELAKKAHVTQSVIARIETNNSRTLPRLDLFKKILSSIGYEMQIIARKGNRVIKAILPV